MPEIARVLKITLATAERHWTYARTWLYAELSDDRDGVPSPQSLPAARVKKSPSECGVPARVLAWKGDAPLPESATTSNPSVVEDIFLAVLEKGSPEERAAFLDSACGDDAELRRRVERLLEAHPRAGKFLENSTPPTDEKCGAHVAAGEQAGEHSVDDVLVPHHDLVDLGADPLVRSAEGVGLRGESVVHASAFPGGRRSPRRLLQL